MLDGWEDSLEDNEIKFPDCQEQKVKKEDKNVHV